MTVSNSPAPAAGSKAGPLRVVAPAVTALSAVGSVFLQLYAGHRSPQHLVMLLIAGWVLSPFVILLLLNRLAGRWPAFPDRALHFAMLLVSVASLAIYSLAVARPPASKPAAPFVAVPPASWLLTAIVLTFAWLSSRRRPNLTA